MPSGLAADFDLASAIDFSLGATRSKDFHQKHKHLSHEQVVQTSRAKGDLEMADALVARTCSAANSQYRRLSSMYHNGHYVSASCCRHRLCRNRHV
jgi:hypothetical protein